MASTKCRWWVAVAVICAGATTGVANAETRETVDEGWVIVPPQDRGYQGVTFRDEPEWDESISTLRARLSNGRWKGCESISSEPCVTARTVQFSATLQACSRAGQLDCVAEFGILDAAGNKLPAVFSGPFPSSGLNDFPANPQVGLPEGGPAGLWTVPAANGIRIQEHLVRAIVSGEATPGKKVKFQKFTASISPTSMVSFDCGTGWLAQRTSCRTGDTERDVDGDGEIDEDSFGYVFAYGSIRGLDCLLTGNLDASSGVADCAERKALSKEVRYYLTVRLSQVVSGWMHGRLADPTISLVDIPGAPGASTLSITGNPVSVPSIALMKKFSELPTNLQEIYRENGAWRRRDGQYNGASGIGGGGSPEDPSDPENRNRRSNVSPVGEESIAEFEAWLPVVNNTAVADPTTWTVRSLGYDIGEQYGCPSRENRVTGIVTTNATLYRAGAPEFDAKSQSLSYTVAAPRFMSSGEVFKGAYSMIIRSDLARCIYKFSLAPIKATIEVVDASGGTKDVAVTNFNEANGWMKLSATGFTHSTPTIRAKLQQPGSRSSAGGGSSLKLGASVTAKNLVRVAGLSTTKSSRISLAIVGSSRSVCRVAGSTVKTLSRGSCEVNVTVQTGTRRDTKRVTLTVS